MRGSSAAPLVAVLVTLLVTLPFSARGDITIITAGWERTIETAWTTDTSLTYPPIFPDEDTFELCINGVPNWTDETETVYEGINTDLACTDMPCFDHCFGKAIIINGLLWSDGFIDSMYRRTYDTYNNPVVITHTTAEVLHQPIRGKPTSIIVEARETDIQDIIDYVSSQTCTKSAVSQCDEDDKIAHEAGEETGCWDYPLGPNPHYVAPFECEEEPLLFTMSHKPSIINEELVALYDFYEAAWDVCETDAFGVPKEYTYVRRTDGDGCNPNAYVLQLGWFTSVSSVTNPIVWDEWIYDPTTGITTSEDIANLAGDLFSGGSYYDPCITELQWRGVQCDMEGHIVQVHLCHALVECDGVVWRGNIIDIAAFQYLRIFGAQNSDFWANNIPEDVGTISTLQSFDVRSTNLAGSLPSSFFTISTIKYINLAINDFEGEMPDTSGLEELVYLYLDNNNFGPEFGASGTQAKKLKEVDISSNAFTSITEDLSGLESLVSFSCANNDIAGDVPDLWPKTIQYIDLSHNTFSDFGRHQSIYAINETDGSYIFITGDMINDYQPQDIQDWGGFDLPVLETLKLSDNAFGVCDKATCSGWVPEGLANAAIKYVDLARNRFGGDDLWAWGSVVRMLMSNFATLEHVDISDNRVGIFHKRLNGGCGDYTYDANIDMPYTGKNENGRKRGETYRMGTSCSMSENEFGVNPNTGTYDGNYNVGFWKDGIHIKNLYMQGNDFVGRLPHLPHSIENFDASNNVFSGDIREQYGELKNIKYMNLARNLFHDPCDKDAVNEKTGNPVYTSLWRAERWPDSVNGPDGGPHPCTLSCCPNSVWNDRGIRSGGVRPPTGTPFQDPLNTTVLELPPFLDFVPDTMDYFDEFNHHCQAITFVASAGSRVYVDGFYLGYQHCQPNGGYYAPYSGINANGEVVDSLAVTATYGPPTAVPFSANATVQKVDGQFFDENTCYNLANERIETLCRAYDNDEITDGTSSGRVRSGLDTKFYLKDVPFNYTGYNILEISFTYLVCPTADLMWTNPDTGVRESVRPVAIANGCADPEEGGEISLIDGLTSTLDLFKGEGVTGVNLASTADLLAGGTSKTWYVFGEDVATVQFTTADATGPHFKLTYKSRIEDNTIFCPDNFMIDPVIKEVNGVSVTLCTPLCQPGERVEYDAFQNEFLCDSCTPNTYQPLVNIDENCIPCPINSQTLPGAGGGTSISACHCNTKFVGELGSHMWPNRLIHDDVVETNVEECFLCSSDFDCEDKTVKAGDGIFKPALSYESYECPAPMDCLVSNNLRFLNSTICKEGAQGPKCAVCAVTHYRIGASGCGLCPPQEQAMTGIIFLVVGVMLIIIIMFVLLQKTGSGPKRTGFGGGAGRPGGNSSAEIKIVIGALQVFSGFADYDVRWPNNFSTLSSLFSFVNVQFVDLAAPNCASGEVISFLDSHVFMALLPFILIAIIGTFYVYSIIKLKFDDPRDIVQRKAKLKSMCFKGGLWLVTMSYPGVSTVLVQYFNQKPVGVENYLAIDFKINVAGGDPLSDLYVDRLGFAVFFLILIPIGMPLGLIVTMLVTDKKRQLLLKDPKFRRMLKHITTPWDNLLSEAANLANQKKLAKQGKLTKRFKKKADERRRSLFAIKSTVHKDGRKKTVVKYVVEESRFAFLTDDYTEAFFFWEVVDMLRKLSMNLIPVFLEPGTPAQLFTGALFVFLFLLLILWARPYKGYSQNLMTAMLIVQFFTLMIGIGLKTDIMQGKLADISGTFIVVVNLVWALGGAVRSVFGD